MNRARPVPCPCNASRRAMLADAARWLSISLFPAMGAARAQTPEAPALAESDPAAVAVNYVEDANRAKDAQPGANCTNCVQYKDAGGGLGDCKLFPGKRVKATGWCSAWSDL